MYVELFHCNVSNIRKALKDKSILSVILIFIK